jgi:hypothetical protein
LEAAALDYLRGILRHYCRRDPAAFRPSPSDPFDWAAFAALAQLHDVVPLVHDWLHRHAPDEPPRPVLEALGARSTSTRLNNLRITQELLRLAELFSSHNIPYVSLKGPALAQQLYGNLALRESGDVDILVPPSQLPAARRLLAEKQYRCDFDWRSWREVIFQKMVGYHYAYVNPEETVRVELHWAVSPPKQRCWLDGPPFWSRVTSTQVAGKSIAVSPPEDVLPYLCLHGARHWWCRLKWLMDVGMLISGYPDLDWDHATEQARDARILRIFYLGVHLAQQNLDVPVPPAVQKRIAAERAVQEMAERIQTLFLREGVEREPDHSDRWWFHSRLRERLRDRIRTSVLEGTSQLFWRM